MEGGESRLNEIVGGFFEVIAHTHYTVTRATITKAWEKAMAKATKRGWFTKKFLKPLTSCS